MERRDVCAANSPRDRAAVSGPPFPPVPLPVRGPGTPARALLVVAVAVRSDACSEPVRKARKCPIRPRFAYSLTGANLGIARPILADLTLSGQPLHMRRPSAVAVVPPVPRRGAARRAAVVCRRPSSLMERPDPGRCCASHGLRSCRCRPEGRDYAPAQLLSFAVCRRRHGEAGRLRSKLPNRPHRGLRDPVPACAVAGPWPGHSCPRAASSPVSLRSPATVAAGYPPRCRPPRWGGCGSRSRGGPPRRRNCR